MTQPLHSPVCTQDAKVSVMGYLHISTYYSTILNILDTEPTLLLLNRNEHRSGGMSGRQDWQDPSFSSPPAIRSTYISVASATQVQRSWLRGHGPQLLLGSSG